MYVSSHTGSTYVKADGSAAGTGDPASAPAAADPDSAPLAGEPPRTGEPASTDRPRTKAAQKEATTQALLAAAGELFAARGYAAVGTEEIVQQAGVTRGALYHHFRGGKEELFRAVLVRLSAETFRRVAEAASTSQDPWDALVAGADAFLDACATPDVQRIMLIDGPAVLGWEVWRAIDTDYGLGLLEQVLQRAMETGTILPASTTAVAHVLAGALDEAAMVVARADDPVAARAEMGQTVRRLLDGLRGPAA